MSKSSDLVFIHGYGGSNCSWHLVDEKVREFSSPSYIELVGFGNHAPPKNFDYSVESQAEILSLHIKNNVDKDATIVAHSYGAAVLLVAMLDHGLKPKKVILVDPLAYQQKLPFFINGQTIPILSPLISRVLTPSFQVDLVLKEVYADFSKVNKHIRQCYISEFEIPFHRLALRKTARELASFDASIFVDRYRNLSANFHIIWGGSDPLISVKNLPRLSRDLNAKTAVSIPKCGHAPHEECPVDFLQAVRNVVEFDEK